MFVCVRLVLVIICRRALDRFTALSSCSVRRVAFRSRRPLLKYGWSSGSPRVKLLRVGVVLWCLRLCSHSQYFINNSESLAACLFLVLNRYLETSHTNKHLGFRMHSHVTPNIFVTNDEVECSFFSCEMPN